MTKIALLFAGFALIGPGTLLCSSAFANQTAPTEYKEVFHSLDLAKPLAKRISVVVKAGRLRQDGKSESMDGQIIRATPLQLIWSENAIQKAQRQQVLALSLKAMVSLQAKVLSQTIEKTTDTLKEAEKAMAGSDETAALMSSLAEAIRGNIDYKEIAAKLKEHQDGAREIVEQVENYQSLLKENLEAGMIAGGMSQEDIAKLKEMAAKSEWKLENFVPGSFGVHFGFKLTQAMLEILRKMGGRIGKMAEASDGSFTLTYLAQPWEVEVITSPLQSSKPPTVEKYLFIQTTPHLWINRNHLKAGMDPVAGRGFNWRAGITLISGNVEDFRTFFGGFIGVSFDPWSNVNVKLGSLVTAGEQMLGNHYLMISPQYAKSTKGLTNSAVAEFIDALDTDSSFIGRIKAKVRGFTARSQPRINHGVVVPVTSQALRSFGNSFLDLFRDQALEILKSGGLQQLKGEPSL